MRQSSTRTHDFRRLPLIEQERRVPIAARVVIIGGIVETLLVYEWTTLWRRLGDISNSGSALERCADPRG
jgi:hypothetical protein